MSQTSKEQKQFQFTAPELHRRLKALCEENNAKDDWICPLLHGIATAYQVQQFLLVLHQDWQTVDKNTRRKLLIDVFRFFKETKIINLGVAYPVGVAQFLRRYDVVKLLSSNDLNVFKVFFPDIYEYRAKLTDLAQFSMLLSDIGRSRDYLFLYQPILDEVKKRFKQQESLLSLESPLHQALISASRIKSHDLHKLASIQWLLENKIAINHVAYNDETTSFDLLIDLIKQNHKSKEDRLPNFAEFSPVFQKIISLYDEHIGLENVIVLDEENEKIFTQIQTDLESARVAESKKALIESRLLYPDVFGIVKDYIPKETISTATAIAKMILQIATSRTKLKRNFTEIKMPIGRLGSSIAETSIRDNKSRTSDTLVWSNYLSGTNLTKFFLSDSSSLSKPVLGVSASTTIPETKSSQIEWNKSAIKHALGEIFPAYSASQWHVSLKDHAAWICFESEAERKAAFKAINIELLLNDSTIKVGCGRDQNNGLKHIVILKEITPEALEKLRETPEATSTTTIGL